MKTLLYAAWAVVTVMAVTMLVVLYLMPAHPEPWGPISIALSLMAAAFLAAVHAQHTRMRIAQRAGIPTA
ncbi:MAG: hypothetical protein M3P45_12975 [Acidobacteriota bacterium]|nr:hypothetical protein [Acidobacteriota bacterium]